MENMISDFIERVPTMENTTALELENMQLKKQCENMTSKLEENENITKVQVEEVKEIRYGHKKIEKGRRGRKVTLDRYWIHRKKRER